MIDKTASVHWTGSGKTGQGQVSTETGALAAYPYGFASRFADDRRGTNPEEILGAAHAACFTMAFSFACEKAGFATTTVDTQAHVRLAPRGEGFVIDRIALHLQACVPGIDEARFQKLAGVAKRDCPLSMALAGVPEIKLEARLRAEGIATTEGARQRPDNAPASADDLDGASAEPPHVATAEVRAMSPALVSAIEAVAVSRLLTVGVDALLIEVAHMLSASQISLVVVCDASGAMIGVITETILVRHLGTGQADFFTTRAGEVMTRDYTVCAPTDPLSEVLAMMHISGLIHVPIVDVDHKPTGVVNARDGLRALLAAGNHEEALLRNYVMGIGYQ